MNGLPQEEEALMNAQPPTGPLGQPRGVAFVVLITIVTLGIYGLYWAFVTFDELSNHTKTGIGGALALILAIIFYPAIPFLAGSEVGNMYAADGREKPVTGLTGLWILLPLIGWIIWAVKVQGALNRYWESKAGPAVEAAPAPTA
jgi:Domain of unknown function (DUF4234)